MSETREYFHATDEEPVHSWFQLSYSNYLVVPRTILQSMPLEWQARFVACLEEGRAAMGHHQANDNYTVMLRDERGRIMRDPLANYERGRRRLDPREAAP